MEKDKIQNPKVVQTYVEDMAKVLEGETGGAIKDIIHSAEAEEKIKKSLSPQSLKNRLFMYLGILFVAIGFGLLAYFIARGTAPSIPVQKQYTPIIFTDQNVLLPVDDLKKDPIAKKFLGEMNRTTVKVGQIEAIYPSINKNIIGLRKFIATIDGSFVPGDNSFVDDNFLMGVVNSKIDATSSSKNFFILVKMRSLADIFNPIHAWENKMFTDLHGFLGIDLSAETKYLFTKDFEDGIIENKNARILYDQGGQIVLMYVFANDNSVVITDSVNAVREIMLRLATSKIQK